MEKIIHSEHVFCFLDGTIIFFLVKKEIEKKNVKEEKMVMVMDMNQTMTMEKCRTLTVMTKNIIIILMMIKKNENVEITMETTIIEDVYICFFGNNIFFNVSRNEK